ncbi:C69 family dipeptidase [Vaginisenegalia massiliensis]|uniref:C69 family dipeptidase n=1 Tax=Vaginisenegalia massiliensis TaxID=2058294 RepID=UPI000F52AF91|nr:C69 family dipeptidase [Vaginisenegalia massiliensis]
MACTTILVGKKASYDGSTLVARNEDSPSGEYTPKKMIAVSSKNHPTRYKSVLGHFEVELPETALSYTLTPDAVPTIGVWGACGINEKNVAMSATETITSNDRVLGADPLVEYQEAQGQPGEADYQAEKLGGISEEDMVSLVLPYIHSAREGVLRLGQLLEEYGTSEMNGIAFQDVEEIWWLETIGGHHWIAKRVPDEAYVVMPNQQGIDSFDFEDAFGQQKDHLCSKDMREFIKDNFLDLSLESEFQARLAFGSYSDADHVYNTPRAWVMGRYFNFNTFKWDGPDADFTPTSDNIPWSFVPERKITIQDIKTILSNHYQGTPYDPYGKSGDSSLRGIYRSIGVNRNNFLGLTQIRPYLPESIRSLQWMAFGSNVFNAMIPLYTQVTKIPDYLANTGARVNTDNIYWASRIVGALADAHYYATETAIERYQLAVAKQAVQLLKENEQVLLADPSQDSLALCEKANQNIVDMLKKETDQVLDKVLYLASNGMKNAFSRSDN